MPIRKVSVSTGRLALATHGGSAVGLGLTRNGATVGGHLLAGIEVSVAEVIIRELVGVALVRQFDEETGLAVVTRPSKRSGSAQDRRPVGCTPLTVR